MEDLDAFRQRARAWIREHLQPVGAITVTLRNERTDEEELACVARDRELQRMLYDAGLAGLCFPTEYGGHGYPPEYQRVLNEELIGYEFPSRVQVPTFVPCSAVLLEFGTEEQKRQHIPAMLKGEEIWLQFLSEPSGGSDVAGALTTAVRDGEEWVLNGSKVWTTGAWWSDWALCLARTNWDVPKHRGLTVFMFPIHQHGIEVQRIEMLNGNKEFCQEFMTDVRVPDSHRVGEVDDGWTVATRWMAHERVLYNSPLCTFPPGTIRGSGGVGSLLDIAKAAAHEDDPVVAELIGEARMLDRVEDALQARLGEGILAGVFTDQASAIGRLFDGYTRVRKTTLAYEIAGATGAAWSDDDGVLTDCGTDFLMRQAACIGGGTTEMARNVISERVLGMPRERTHDRDLPFRDVPRSGGRNQ
jgi:alkylation response protein AidB-like acyl-CoA dehydrogenase